MQSDQRNIIHDTKIPSRVCESKNDEHIRSDDIQNDGSDLTKRKRLDDNENIPFPSLKDDITHRKTSHIFIENDSHVLLLPQPYDELGQDSCETGKVEVIQNLDLESSDDNNESTQESTTSIIEKTPADVVPVMDCKKRDENTAHPISTNPSFNSTNSTTGHECQPQSEKNIHLIPTKKFRTYKGSVTNQRLQRICKSCKAKKSKFMCSICYHDGTEFWLCHDDTGRHCFAEHLQHTHPTIGQPVSYIRLRQTDKFRTHKGNQTNQRYQGRCRGCKKKKSKFICSTCLDNGTEFWLCHDITGRHCFAEHVQHIHESSS